MRCPRCGSETVAVDEELPGQGQGSRGHTVDTFRGVADRGERCYRRRDRRGQEAKMPIGGLFLDQLSLFE